jgi:pimeloyl-ACP methyl ester carboxylesterase
MTFIRVNDSQLEVRHIAGNEARAPLVFLHEGLGSVSMWSRRGLDWPQAVCDATGRAGLVYSRRGSGRSAPAVTGRHQLQADYMHREAFEVLPALLLNAQNFSACFARPVLLGHSDGATIALLYASRFDPVACIAMAPHVWVEPVALDAIRSARRAFEAGALRTSLAKYHSDVDTAFWQWNDVWLSSAFRSFDIRQDCAAISAPLLLIQGLDDEYGTLAQLDDIAQAAPHAEQLRLHHCGHSPQRDQSEKTIAAIARFLQDIQ